MGACCGKAPKKKPPSNSQPPNIVNVPEQPPLNPVNQAPPHKQPDPPQPIVLLTNIYKPIANSRKLIAFIAEENKSHELPVSLPFPFYEDSGICRTGPNEFFIAGGFECDNGKEISDECMYLEANLLTGTRKSPLPMPTAGQTLLFESETKQIYAVGGLQKRSLEESSEDMNEFQVGAFCVFDLANNKWNVLDEMPCTSVCCPTCYMSECKIYAAGGFSGMHEAEFRRYEDVQIYDLSDMSWSVVRGGFPLGVSAALAHPVSHDSVLVMGGMTKIGENSPIAYMLHSNGSYTNLETFEIPNIRFVSPVYVNKDQNGDDSEICFLTEPDYLVSFNIATQKLSRQSLRPVIEPIINYSSMRMIQPRQEGIYVYHFDQTNRTLYDLNTHSKEKSSRLLQDIQYRDMGITLLRDGRLFFAGGVGAITSKPTKSCFIYTPVSKEESAILPLPQELRGLQLLSTEDKVYAIAGYDDSSDRSEEVYCFIFKLDTQEWVNMKTLLYRVRYPTVALLNEKIYAIGGEEIDSEGDEELKNYVQVYNIATSSWTVTNLCYPLNCKSMGSISLAGDTILLFGGEDDDGGCVTDSYVFNGEAFQPHEALPGDSAVNHFNDPPCYSQTCVFVFSSCGELYSYEKSAREWEVVEFEELTNNQI